MDQTVDVFNGVQSAVMTVWPASNFGGGSQIAEPGNWLGVDISKEFLLDSTDKLAHDYPWLEVHAVCADFSQVLEIPDHYDEQQHIAFYPGSSIGNFDPDDAVIFMEQKDLQMLQQCGTILAYQLSA